MRKVNEPDYTFLIDGEELTIAQIAARAGVHVDTIYKRVARGVTGKQLLALRHRVKRKPYTPRKS